MYYYAVVLCIYLYHSSTFINVTIVSLASHNSSSLELVDLESLVAPVCYMCWKKIGKELKIANGILNSIQSACGEIEDSLWCCKIMFSSWLNLDTPKSWHSILAAITSPEISKKMETTCIPSEFSDIKGIDKVICDLACNIKINSIKLRHALYQITGHLQGLSTSPV